MSVTSIWDKLRGLFGGGPAEPPSVGEPLPDESASPEELFQSEVVAVAQAAPFIARAERDPEAYAVDLVYEDGERMKCFLGNLYAETRDVMPEERQLRILHFLAVMADRPELPETWEDAAPMLRPVLRPATFFNHGVGPDEPGKQPLRRPVLPFLCEAIAIDHESAMAYAIRENLERWGVTEDEAFAAARANLAQSANLGVELYDSSAAYPLWHVASDDAYESSRLVLPGWLAAFRDKVDGRPVAAVPERSTLLVTGDGNPAALERLLDSADREFRAAPRSISPALYTVDDDGRVVPLRVAADHALAARIHESEVHLAAVEYGAQKRMLEAQLEQRGQDVFVASYSVVQRPDDGRVLSYCTWGENVDSLLPHTELVGFVGGDLESDDAWHFLVPWEAVEREAGDCWRPEPGLEPPRMRTVHWPDAELLERLRQHATDAG